MEEKRICLLKERRGHGVCNRITDTDDLHLYQADGQIPYPHDQGYDADSAGRVESGSSYIRISVFFIRSDLDKEVEKYVRKYCSCSLH